MLDRHSGKVPVSLGQIDWKKAQKWCLAAGKAPDCEQLKLRNRNIVAWFRSIDEAKGANAADNTLFTTYLSFKIRLQWLNTFSP